MTNGKRRSGRLLTLFLIVLALLTFFSRAIYAAMLPQVRTERITAGTVSTEITAETFRLESDLKRTLRLPFSLGDCEFAVEVLAVAEGGMFEAGDDLLCLSAYDGELALFETQLAIDEAMRAEEMWRNAYEAEYGELLSELDSLLVQNRIQEAVAVRREIRHMESAQALDGVCLADLQRETVRCLERQQALLELQADDWRISAPERGTLLLWQIKTGGRVQCSDALLSYAPSDADVCAAVSIGPDWLERASSVSVQALCLDGSQTKWSFLGVERLEGERYILAAPVEGGIFDASAVQSLVFNIRSEYFEAIIPTEAVSFGCVYVLRTRDGAWNGEECYVEKIDVREMAAGEGRTAVAGKLSAGDRVVIYSNKELYDGAEVYSMP